MNYRLEEIDDKTFEALIGTICQKILGMGTVVFSPGRDGGRDAQFEGTAQHYPSNTEPWSGKFIIQAKHTSDPTASCSESKFKNTVNAEIEKVKKLINANVIIDNYLLFTNRKFTGDKGNELLETIKLETGINRVAIIGKETICQYLDTNKEIVRQYKLGLNYTSLNISDEDIKEVILAFKSQLPDITENIQQKIEELKYDCSFIEKDEKNKKNGLTKDYYISEIVDKSLTEFAKLDVFLQNPINEKIKDYYYDAAHEFNQIIVRSRGDFIDFEDLFDYIYQLVRDGSTSLSGSKRFVTLFLHYMYFGCLIGKK